MPNWTFLSHLVPSDDDWSYSSLTTSGWFKLKQIGQFAYPTRAVGLIADAEFLPNGEVLRLEARTIFYSIDAQILFLPPPLILNPTQRRIAVKRLARTPSYTPWELSLFSSDAMPIYNDPQIASKELAFSDSVPTTFAAPPYNAATPSVNYRCLAANANRRKPLVRNKGNANLLIDLDPPTAANSESFSVAPGSTWVCDFEWQGEVYVWSSNNAAQSCQIRELI